MSGGTFVPQPLHRTHCAGCGAARVAHHHTTHACPTPYRPSTLADAMREFEAATAAGDQNRIFAARGEVQRLHGSRHPIPECAVCRMLEVKP
jgi:hypothetical protein